MKVMTFKMSPKTVFGLILVVTGVVVVLLTFVSNHVSGSKSASTQVSCSSAAEGEKYLNSLGWETGESSEKSITVPAQWNDVYMNYNEIQTDQGYDLEPYKGQNVTLYTYEITNYEGYTEGIVADLLVCDGKVIGGDICNTSADNGFMTGLEKRK